MAFNPLPPPRSKTIDFLSLVASADPRYRDPPDVYVYSNGRKFKEFPAPDQSVYKTEDGAALYIPSDGTGSVFYATE